MLLFATDELVDESIWEITSGLRASLFKIFCFYFDVVEMWGNELKKKDLDEISTLWLNGPRKCHSLPKTSIRTVSYLVSKIFEFAVIFKSRRKHLFKRLRNHSNSVVSRVGTDVNQEDELWATIANEIFSVLYGDMIFSAFMARKIRCWLTSA